MSAHVWRRLSWATLVVSMGSLTFACAGDWRKGLVLSGAFLQLVGGLVVVRELPSLRRATVRINAAVVGLVTTSTLNLRTGDSFAVDDGAPSVEERLAVLEDTVKRLQQDVINAANDASREALRQAQEAAGAAEAKGRAELDRLEAGMRASTRRTIDGALLAALGLVLQTVAALV